MKFLEKNTTAIVALGGLGEVGKNMYMLQHQGEIIIIDAGVMFPKDNLFGVDYVIPDLDYLIKNQKKIKALFITHGHEDHIGGIPFLLKKVKIPVIYSAKLGIGLIRHKLKNNNIDLKSIKFYEFSEKTFFQSKFFKVGFYLTVHSIPDAYGLFINTPNGTIVHTGDYKFDFTPVGNSANYAKIAQLGKDGVSLLLADSTNSEVPGFSKSEKDVSDEILEIFQRTTGRIIIATFASNIYRIHKIIEFSIKCKRKIAVFGRSMENVVNISRNIGLLKYKKENFIRDKDLKKYPDKEVTILCTGSQGEELATLSRIANGSHRFIKLKDNDTVIFSSSPIPGNFKNVYELINNLLLRKNINLIYGKERLIHTSGHANKEEQKLMLNLIKPVNFMPIHGEQHMLHEHVKTAKRCGLNDKNCFIQNNGDVLGLKNGKVKYIGKISGNDWFVEREQIGHRNNYIIQERKNLSESGIVIIFLNLTIDKKNNLLSSVKPLIKTYGIEKNNILETVINKWKTNLTLKSTEKITKEEFYNKNKKIIISDSKNKIHKIPIILPIYNICYI